VASGSILSLVRFVEALSDPAERVGRAGPPALASASIQREREYACLLIICQENVSTGLSEGWAAPIAMPVGLFLRGPFRAVMAALDAAIYENTAVSI
jgi:hypothetical protein